MIELYLFLILNLLGILFTLLIFYFRTLPKKGEQEDEEGLPGFALLSAVIAVILWLICAVVAGSVCYTVPYATVVEGELVTGTIQVNLTDSWMYGLVYVLVMIIPFVFIIFLIPETFPKNIK